MVNEKPISPTHLLKIQTSVSDECVEQIAQAVIDLIQRTGLLNHPRKEILTPKEVEELLDISHTTRIEWTRQGVLTAYKLAGRKLFYKYSDIISAMNKLISSD